MPRKPTTKKATISTNGRPKRAASSPKKVEEEKVASPKKSPVKKSPIKKSQSPVKETSTPKKTSTPSPVKKTVKKKKATKKRDSKPTYEKMVLEALEEIGGRRETSGIAIGKYIENNYPVPENYRRFLRVALKKAVENGEITQNKASYKLVKSAAPTTKRSTKRKTSTTKKSSASSSTSSTSKPKRTTMNSRRTAVEETEKPKSKKRTAKESSSSKTTESPKKRTRAASPKSSKEEKTTKPESKKRKTSSKSNGKEESAESGIVAKPTGLKHDHIWQYKDGGWKNYTAAASDVVEDVYQAYLKNKGETDVRAVKSGDWEYMVDFMAMKQTNILHDNHTVRDIRRVQVSG